MIKNNSFYKVSFLVIGIMVANATNLYGAEVSEDYRVASNFLSLDRTPDKQQTKKFIDSLVNLNYISSHNPQYSDLWQVGKVAGDSTFTKKCEMILSNTEIPIQDKQKLADAYLEIKSNTNI